MLQVRIERDQVFGETELECLTADVYLPEGGDSRPIVLLIHGGAFQSGSKEMFTEWGALLAQQGYVTVAVNYRLATPAYRIWPRVMDDLREAVKWIVSNAAAWKADPLRMAVIGDSAGAFLGTLLSLQSSVSSYKIRANVGVYGIYDLTGLTDPRLIGMFKRVFGVTEQEAPEVYKEASPIQYIESAASSPIIDASHFIIWGELDKVVDYRQSVAFVEALKKSGIKTKVLSFPDDGHFWFNLLPGVEGGGLQDYPNTEAVPQILEFLKQELSSPLIGNFSAPQIERLKQLKSR